MFSCLCARMCSIKNINGKPMTLYELNFFLELHNVLKNGNAIKLKSCTRLLIIV